MKYNIKKAELLSQFAHCDQRYGEKDYYNYHILGVRDLSLSLFADQAKDLQELCVVALLHDVVEDSDTSIHQIEQLFGGFVANSVALLTHAKGQSRVQYIKEIIDNKDKYPYAWMVKVADTMFNLQESLKRGDNKRILKYSDQLHTLHS